MRKTLLWVIGACLSASPVAAVLATQAAQTTPAADPFTNRTLAYERMEEQYRALEMKAKIAKQQYQIARYRRQIGALGGGVGRAAREEDSAKDVKITRLKDRIDALAQVVAKMNANRKAAPRAVKTLKVASKPSSYGIVAVIRDGKRWTALLPRKGGSLVTLRQGTRYAGRRVEDVGSSGVRLSGGRWLRIRNVTGVVSVSPVTSTGPSPQENVSASPGAGIAQSLRSRLMQEATVSGAPPITGVSGGGYVNK